ncbi:hypothetical protein NCS57_01094400 [Fusarium keratoplasticum]|uniref:Uncharacterized protein n=1 Tax=Fusarium keratoplasticum TaxID=1328300 RepID=A0ACC0QJ89_9HYPO|nr:hypothetical protein NCS57_01094400 [Fusarium keratoplasticum]KAI8657167.1 hypothetical protein NCS57_01094400 [Fusarium keratoplasticum]KAI8658145.1 hypothetical protein NCS55_01089500 [Fusarium keratoplasticum]
MAETFGIVTGAIGLAGLFQQCVECFEYIQLGRHFVQDFGRCRLKLDIAKRRLNRWGEAVKIHENPQFTDTKSEEIQEVLEEIANLFDTIQRSSKRYERKAPKEELECLSDENLQPVFRGLHARWGKISPPKQRDVSLIKKATWALYDAKYFEKLIGEVTGFVDDLEKIYPAEQAQRRLVQIEIEDISDEESLTVLQETTNGTDSLLAAAVKEKANNIAVTNYAREIQGEDNAKVRLGNDWSTSALSTAIGIDDRTRNEAGSVVAKGSSTVHIGNRYGD